MRVLLNEAARLANHIQDKLDNDGSDSTVDDMIGYTGQQVDSDGCVNLAITEAEYIFLSLKYL